MREKLKALADLQKVDLEIASHRKSAEVYPKQLAELEKELVAARGQVEAERERLLDIERRKRSLEQTIVDEKDKVKKWESRLTEQRSPREYAALAREIDIAKKANMGLGEELSELGSSQLGAREGVKQKEQGFAAKQDQAGSRMADLKDKVGGAHELGGNLEVKRSEVAAKVDKTMLHRYEQVRKKRTPALASVIAGTCQGCNMNVPPQLYNNLRTSLGMDLCPSCHRIIYAVEALEPADEAN